MNSCLYECTVMHHRLEPKKNWFQYKIFFFYLDLDEIDEVAEKIWLISRNRFNVFNFRDKDHLEFPRENPVKGKTVKENILTYLKEQNPKIDEKGRIMLLTNLCTWGYQFNPVSFYYCFDGDEATETVVEIGNTFLEQKPFYIGKDKLKEDLFHLNTIKHFYVSPFIDHDTVFDFRLKVPGEKLDIKIDDQKQDGTRFFITTLMGKKVALTNGNMIRYALRFPFITLKVIGLIHWQAMKLWLRGFKFHRKSEFPELQKEVYKPYKS